jgi:hypothetical protein
MYDNEYGDWAAREKEAAQACRLSARTSPQQKAMIKLEDGNGHFKSDITFADDPGRRRRHQVTTVFKAQATGDQIIPDLELSAVEPLPEIRSVDESFYRPALTGVFEREAEKIVDALITSLPGGTIDQVLTLLLRRKASIYVVREREMMKFLTDGGPRSQTRRSNSYEHDSNEQSNSTASAPASEPRRPE